MKFTLFAYKAPVWKTLLFPREPLFGYSVIPDFGDPRSSAGSGQALSSGAWFAHGCSVPLVQQLLYHSAGSYLHAFVPRKMQKRLPSTVSTHLRK